MKYAKSILTLLLLLGTASAHAQLYKWVGPDGKVTYSDLPPPSSAKQVERKSLSANGSDTTGMPYELAQAVRNNPVVLYTTAKCTTCDSGRQLLAARGVPFSEKTVNSNDDIERLRKISGANQLPVIFVGRNKQTGFESGAWNTALTAAGYPETNQLPKSYQPSVESAAPAAKVATEKQPTKNDAPDARPLDAAPPRATGNAPSGFRF